MMRKIVLGALLAGLLGPSAFVPARAQALEKHAEPTVNGVHVESWVYRSQGLRVRGLLFVPPRAEHFPTVVFCHDGTSGVSREHRMASLRLAQAGYVVFSPSYRGEDGSEGTIEVAKGEVEDVLNALPLLRTLPQVDPERIALAGTSHGALISALAASRSEHVKAIVLAYGVMDIYRWWSYLERARKVGHDPITQRTYGNGPADHPLSFSSRNAVALAPKIHCPVLLLQGEKDDIVPAEQARLMKQALEASGGSCQMEIYPDCLHGFLVYVPYMRNQGSIAAAERRQTQQSWTTMLAFLKRTIGAGGS